MVAVVERLHPVVVDLQVPEAALGHAVHLDQQRFVLFEGPVAVVVEDVGVSAYGLAQRLQQRWCFELKCLGQFLHDIRLTFPLQLP